MKPRLVLFGTPHYSLIVFEKLFAVGYPIVGVITKPPRPFGRLKIMNSTPVAKWASQKQIPLLAPTANSTKPWLFADEKILTQQVMSLKPDLLITADFTQKIPQDLYLKTKYGGLNVHPSLLPTYRGPAPVPWAILNGEKETGVSLVTLSENFDSGIIVAQVKEPILPTDTTDTLLTRLFAKGADLLINMLPKYLRSPTTYNLQLTTNTSYFPRLTRNTGFEPWEKIKAAMETGVDAERIERKWRAFHPWPGLWTKIMWAVGSGQLSERRLKILRCHLTANQKLQTTNFVLDEIQPEGKQPVVTNISHWLALVK